MRNELIAGLDPRGPVGQTLVGKRDIAPASHDENPAMLTQANLSSFVTYNPLALTAETPLADALQTLVETGVHHWPVVNDRRQLVGILSEREIVHALTRLPAQLAVASNSATSDSEASFAGNPRIAQAEELSVADAMSAADEFITLDESPRHVLRKLLDHELHRLPVVQDEMVIGVTTVTDFLREFSYGELGLARKQVSELMEPLDSIGGEATLQEAWDALREQPAGCLGVARGDFPLGVLSERDLRLAMCRLAASDWLADRPDENAFASFGPRTVLELVVAAPTMRPGARLRDAATLMLEHDRQAIAVVNQANRMMGAVTELGILRRMHGYLI